MDAWVPGAEEGASRPWVSGEPRGTARPKGGAWLNPSDAPDSRNPSRQRGTSPRRRRREDKGSSTPTARVHPSLAGLKPLDNAQSAAAAAAAVAAAASAAAFLSARWYKELRARFTRVASSQSRMILKL
eukprot:s1889_g2.t1